MSQTSSCDLPTLAFYEKHGQEYYKSTVNMDLRELYDPFLSKLPPAGRILDAGCGSGRDTKAFLERGYCVLAIDASPQMAELATVLTGQKCEVRYFQEMEFREEFDGIWACASLLHIPKNQMPNVMRRFIQALKPSGVFYISLKEGEGERVAEDGRFFNYYTVESFRQLLADFPALREVTVWKTEEIRSHLHKSPWLNFLLKKQT